MMLMMILFFSYFFLFFSSLIFFQKNFFSGSSLSVISSLSSRFYSFFFSFLFSLFLNEIFTNYHSISHLIHSRSIFLYLILSIDFLPSNKTNSHLFSVYSCSFFVPLNLNLFIFFCLIFCAVKKYISQ